MIQDQIREAVRARYKELSETGGAENVCEKIMAEFGLARRTIFRIVAEGRASNPDPTSEEHENPDYLVKATSTLYDANGKQVLKWIKAEKDSQTDTLKEMFEAMREDLPRIPKRKAEKKTYSRNLLSVIPFGDPHIGVLAHAKESGASYDLKMAERDLCAAVDRLVNTAPDSEHCLIVNLGDFYHSDFIDSRTWRSGHALDTDSRYSKTIRVGVRAMRQCIESALEKHKTVTVINAIGNHDDHTSLWLTLCLGYIYEHEPRVTINDLPRAVHFHEFGKVMIAVTHGHSIKMANLPLVAASEEAEMWGRTAFRYGLTGHIHHDSAKELSGMKVESFRTLAARDYYAASHGYKSGRDMKLLVMHKDYGEVERHTVSIEMLNDSYGTE